MTCLLDILQAEQDANIRLSSTFPIPRLRSTILR